MSDHIPFHIQVEIIKWLPVKSLLRFRSVSKEWKLLIESSKFINAHSVCKSKPHHLLVRYEDHNNVQKFVTFVDDYTFPQQKSFVPDIPLCVKELRRLRILGPSKGLLCMYSTYLSGFEGYDHDFGGKYLSEGLAVLWNPSIRKFVAINLHNVSPEILNETVLGFVVCPVTNDPKIIKIPQYDPKYHKHTSKYCWKLEIYTLSSGKWRTRSIDKPPEVFILPWLNEVVDRFNYWIVANKNKTTVDGGLQSLMLSFDMINESFRVINLPDSLGVLKFMDLSLSKLRESLVVLQSIQKHVCVVWMMDHGELISFTKLFTIDIGPQMTIRTSGFRKSGESVIQIGELDDKGLDRPVPLVSYEHNSKHSIDFGIHGLYSSFSVNSYMETLLLVDQPNLTKELDRQLRNKIAGYILT